MTPSATPPSEPASAQPKADRRLAPRYVSRRWRTARLIARPSLRSYQATIHDFSRVSVGLILDGPFDVGTVLAIELHSAQAGLSCLLSAHVRHVTQQRDGTWLIGCTI